MKPLTFDDWLRHVFDHPVTKPTWYMTSEMTALEPSPLESVSNLTRLFSNPVPLLAKYSDAQINQGFWFLGDYDLECLMDPNLPWPQRLEGIRSIYTLFEQLFATRCSDHLCHRNEQGVNPMNQACYMWWEFLNTVGRPNHEIDGEILRIMKRVLALDSVACQESALHGLGHWQTHYPEFVTDAVDEFLASRLSLRPELKEYAEAAQRGDVL